LSSPVKVSLLFNSFLRATALKVNSTELNYKPKLRVK
jgi:hypothetical protein